MKRFLLIISLLVCAGSVHAQSNVNANVITKATTVPTSAYAAAKLMKSGPGKLVSITVHNTGSGTNRYLYIVDAAAVPADAATIVNVICGPISVGSDTTVMITLPVPLSFSTGLVAWMDLDGDLTKGEMPGTGVFITGQTQ